MNPAIKILFVTCLLAIGNMASAIEPVFSDKSGYVIRGYDPVAYFTEGKPVKGSDQIVHEWNGGHWKFVSQENLKAFIATPDRYAPQYGGYCAWAASQGYTASIDPAAWYVHDDKLYLNYSKRIQRKWQRDIPGNVSAGDENWPRLLNE